MSEHQLQAAVKAGLKLAERACDPYPTPEGWEAARRQNTRTVQAAYRALDALTAMVREQARKEGR